MASAFLETAVPDWGNEKKNEGTKVSDGEFAEDADGLEAFPPFSPPWEGPKGRPQMREIEAMGGSR